MPDRRLGSRPGRARRRRVTDGDTLVASLGADVVNGTLLLYPNGSFTYTPDDSFTGADTFLHGDGRSQHLRRGHGHHHGRAADRRPLQFDLTLTEGWNLVSVPIEAAGRARYGDVRRGDVRAGVAVGRDRVRARRGGRRETSVRLYSPTGPVTIPIVGTAVDSVRAVPAGWSLSARSPPSRSHPCRCPAPAAAGLRARRSCRPASDQQRGYLASGDTSTPARPRLLGPPTSPPTCNWAVVVAKADNIAIWTAVASPLPAARHPL